ncbi:MAG: sigma-E factor negative regulatory protein [Burkholderiales bacterium]
MATYSELDAAALERLSALVDGELDGHAIAQACADWRHSDEARSTWHEYHVIGDVLRSEDLACDPARDAGFLEALRARMKDEPVVLAPQPREAAAVVPPPAVAMSSRSRRWSWMAPSAVAAGFVAVAGVLVLTRGPGGAVGGGSAGASLAQAGTAVPAAATLVGVMPSASEPQALVLKGRLIRDARLDRYLAAHKQFAGSSALGVPSGFLRNATAIESER